ncbi:RPB5 subunit of DNA-directed RNA polymerase [Eremomyces bilateralis CBS 781.70]|uniref:DNA-directed RNA polymerases I, II, and III subunit RPABC1 n=1 Tax=Eremomyces bilateralis CBS 781.70 TaxID=1392243 RepID=A0A6G1GEP6_9PEZI|nr:RPB5 subunit of DNA-directed RNA polymerase [Eremomyces bilateralis CBS 781.70]KAF1816386.1 RPB5 subunit of DNA-directed RNA polymerase [Eremomyces bilateralis CBS 781.70]
MDDSGEGSKDLVKMWRIYKTVKELCRDRGYEVTDEEIEISLDDFRAQYGDPLGFADRGRMRFHLKPSAEMLQLYMPPPKKDQQVEPQIGNVYVEFNNDENLGIKQMRQFAHTITENNFYTGILVHGVDMTPSARKLIPTVLPHIIELFKETDLLVNITKHELVPKHILLSREEKAKLLERYRLKESQLPRMQVNDPVARYMGLRRGQVVKIIRRSETAGRYASYRWVI